MKKRVLKRTKAQRAKQARKLVRHHPGPRPKDPKDLRGAKGALLESAAEAALADESLDDQVPGQRHPPIRIRSDWEANPSNSVPDEG